MFWFLNFRGETELLEKIRGKGKYLVDYIPTTKRAQLSKEPILESTYLCWREGVGEKGLIEVVFSF
jgi:hypothetical protein